MNPTPLTPQRWSLNDLFSAYDAPETLAAIESLRTDLQTFANWREQLTADIPEATFLKAVAELEDLSRRMYKLYGFAELWFAEDTQKTEAQTFVARISQFAAEFQNQTLFFQLWWKTLDDENASRLMAASGDYRYFLQQIRAFKPHTLTEPEEKIINIKNVTGVSALQRIYDTLTNRYVFRLQVEGETKELTRGQLMAYVRGGNPELRAQAYQELYRIYGEDGDLLGQIYQSIVQDWHNENVDLRHFETPIATRNLNNDIPDSVVETLLQVCEKNAPLFQRYFRLKAKHLGIEKLRRYDLYAPIAAADKTYSYDYAVQLVLQSFDDFLPQIGSLARRVFDQNHLDSEVRKGKRDGAFCASVVDKLTPWVLVNYQGKADDVSTLAHELGHAIHAMLAEQHGLFTFHSSLPLAETASTFAEMLLVDRLLAEETDESVRRDILFSQMDDAYATIQRQAFFALFERAAHSQIQQGASPTELAETYWQNLQTQFGDAVEVGEEFRWEWVSIPHIYHTPFYVYAYSFGQLLVLSLYKQFKQEGEPFKARYAQILAAGGSDAPASILARAGIDIHSAEFWQGGFDVLHDLLAQLEQIPIA
ncbi:MAG: M3 family oligoendopeptidase [Anaerolineales bacterium]